ncbi:Protein of unknown function [Sulfurivirga caldicuralii]|uniref:Tll0287-like domain-containing protein n=1 Tax=Sulfurivirga caldicuralii TaxID=364032 RepID=A0A1N6GLA8_9GAMM|nr:DUF3365 domain-containing protein [Sulfurivirga caldicuralii]SIO08338.1 Protein of unknown function [Sulfurivirga caldicuralii]
MKKTLIATLMAAMAGTAWAGDADVSALKEEGREIARQFLGTLKPELQKAMKSGGPVHAIDVCHKKAPQITAELSKKTGWELKRTSTKVRNPNNAPDEWEKRVLAQFEQQKARGADVKKLEVGEVVEENGHKVFRYAKAIPTGKVCVACHGAHVHAPVMEAIKTYYPHDQATGFKPGDIRGMFSFKKPL